VIKIEDFKEIKKLLQKDGLYFGESEKLDNMYHPDRSSGTNWKCPVCNIFD
jgi:hypothetical protein